MGIFVLYYLFKFSVVFFSPVINIDTNISIAQIFSYSYTCSLFYIIGLADECLLKQIVLYFGESVFVFLDRIFDIVPSFNLVFHFLSAVGAKSFKWHCWLAFMTRILEVQFNLKIVTELFILQNRIWFN